MIGSMAEKYLAPDVVDRLAVVDIVCFVRQELLSEQLMTPTDSGWCHQYFYQFYYKFQLALPIMEMPLLMEDFH